MLVVRIKASKRLKRSVIIPAEIAEALGIVEGVYIIEVEGGNVVLRPIRKHLKSRRQHK